MLDTVILQLEKENYYITDKSRFIQQKHKKGYCSWVNNPDYSNAKSFVYMPRLTLMQRGARQYLKIEFSAPKIIFNNNVNELTDDDFDFCIERLRDKLNKMGVKIFSQVLKNAQVLSFHPSKNIPLKGGRTVTYILKHLNKVDVNNKFDLDNKKFNNTGEVLQYYTDCHAIVIYDKKNDLKKAVKRATDKNQTKQDELLFDTITAKKEYFELLRIEIRIKGKRKMNKVLENADYQKDPTFKDIFNYELCKKIINNYWKDFFTENLFLFALKNDAQTVLENISAVQPNITPLKLEALIGLHALAISNYGLRGLKNIYKQKKNYGWSRTKKKLEIFNNEIFIQDNVLSDLSVDIKKFKTFKLDDKYNLIK